MNSFLAQVFFAVIAIVSALALPERRRALWCGLAVSGIGIFGVITGVQALSGAARGFAITVALPIGSMLFATTHLGALFIIVVGAAGAVTALFAIGYVHGPANSRTAWIALALFLTAMQFIPASADVVSFLLLWELMAISSTALVLTEYQHQAQVRSAALWYAVMTQLSFVLLLLGFAVLAKQSGSTSFASIADLHTGSAASSLAFIFLVVGFATKAGIVPLHIWLPRAHPEAPSHVSALMSAAMVKLGIYGAILVATRLLPAGPSWWGLLILIPGALSALYGILQASVAADLKRLLAYSTTENVGLMFLALGAALLMRSYGLVQAGEYALAACLLLVIAHAAFKTLLFLGAGSIIQATGEGDLDRLGGLSARMPVTSATFAVGALGAAALPVTAGFAGEWVLFQVLIHGATNAGGRVTNRLLAVVMPLSVGVVALTAGLALMTFVKAFGIAFLGRARSEGAQKADESNWWMQIAMSISAVVLVALGLIPGRLGVQSAADLGSNAAATSLGGIQLSKFMTVLNPLALLLLAVAIAVLVLAKTRASAQKNPRRRVDLAWGSGGMRISPRMQYTATSYAEPLARIFDDVLKPERDIVMMHAAESQYLVEHVRFRQQVTDVFEARIFAPILRRLDDLGVKVRKVQNGRIQAYLGYSFVALLIVLLVVAL